MLSDSARRFRVLLVQVCCRSPCVLLLASGLLLEVCSGGNTVSNGGNLASVALILPEMQALRLQHQTAETWKQPTMC